MKGRWVAGNGLLEIRDSWCRVHHVHQFFGYFCVFDFVKKRNLWFRVCALMAAATVFFVLGQCGKMTVFYRLSPLGFSSTL